MSVNSKKEKQSPEAEKKEKKELKPIFKPFVALGRYFKNSWKELKQVRWPDRKATWSMILAVVAFSCFFILVITLLDIAFDELFNLIVK